MARGKIAYPPLTAERLRAVLNYNPETGKFEWVKHLTPRSTLGFGRGRRGQVGTISRWKKSQKMIAYRVIGIDNRLYHAHRIAWLWMTGEWPNGEVDHINRDPLDNRWSNLRDVTRKENEANKNHKRISWNTKDKRWVVHYSFEKREHAEALVRQIEAWLHT